MSKRKRTERQLDRIARWIPLVVPMFALMLAVLVGLIEAAVL